MWSFNGRDSSGTKHFRGLTSDADLTDDDSVRLSNEHLRNGDEVLRIDTGMLEMYDESTKTWIEL